MFWLIVIGIVAVIVIVLVTKDNDKIVTLDDVIKNNSQNNFQENDWWADPSYQSSIGNIYHDDSK